MVEELKSKLEEAFGKVRWENVSSVEGLALNLPDLVVCMGIKGGKELILGFSRDLISRILSKKLECDPALVGEREIVSEVKNLALNITRDLRDIVVPPPVVLKGTFMELMVHKAKITACSGAVSDRGGLFLGIVEPQESSSQS
ncbi:MAG: hypothetical protein J7M13_00985 [Synergistetes bacterium]|nr:hypothetical protein [Synergistota bacterium]